MSTIQFDKKKIINITKRPFKKLETSANFSIKTISKSGYKQVSKNLVIEYSVIDTIYGKVLVATINNDIVEVVFKDNNSINKLTNRWPRSKFIEINTPIHNNVKDFINGNSNIKLSLLLKGTPFQINVWKELLKINKGELRTYAQIAKALSTKGYRAVGSAVGDNPISIIIPCHRVVNTNGETGKYAWGEDIKHSILINELVLN